MKKIAANNRIPLKISCGFMALMLTCAQLPAYFESLSYMREAKKNVSEPVQPLKTTQSDVERLKKRLEALKDYITDAMALHRIANSVALAPSTQERNLRANEWRKSAEAFNAKYGAAYDMAFDDMISMLRDADATNQADIYAKLRIENQMNYVSGLIPGGFHSLGAELKKQENTSVAGKSAQTANNDAKVAGNDFESVKKAAEQGNANAQYNLGVCYAEGKGVKQDYTEAVKWFVKAAGQGNAEAQFNIGFLYERGTGVNKDYTEAIKWYKKAAEQGISEAQFKLGMYYEYGIGVEKDAVKAAGWFLKAAEQGNTEARKRLGM